MSTEAQSLPNDVATLVALVREQHATIAALSGEVDQLKHYVERLLRERYGPRSEKLDPNQMLLFGSDNDVPPVAPRDEHSITIKEHERQKRRSRKLPDSLPRERVEHDLSDADKLCPGCGDVRQRIGNETSTQLDFVPASLKVIEHVRYKYACKCCEGYVAIAAAPAKPIEKGIPGPGLLAHLVVSKYGEHMPLYRLEDEFARHGVELSRGTLCRWAGGMAGLLMPLYTFKVMRVRRSGVIHTDDTPVPVLDSSLPKTRTGRFWVYAGDEDNPYTVYEYTSSRERDGPATFLREFQGFLQADAYGGYDGIYATGNVKQVSCWAHARRKFFDAQETDKTRALTMLAMARELYAVEDEAMEYSDEARRALRQEKSVPILTRIKTWLDAESRVVLPRSLMSRAMGYVNNQWNALCVHTTEGLLSIDNNAAERALKRVAIGRKNWLFAGNDQAAQTAAKLYSLIASAERHGVDPQRYLTSVLAKIQIVKSTFACVSRVHSVDSTSGSGSFCESAFHTSGRNCPRSSRGVMASNSSRRAANLGPVPVSSCLKNT